LFTKSRKTAISCVASVRPLSVRMEQLGLPLDGFS
jgi:hypothetical protein